MATRESIGDCIARCEVAMEFANEQLDLAQRQEHYQDIEYSQAQQALESAFMEIDKLEESSNAQQREELYRTRIRVQQLQNQMILQNHDRPPVSTLHIN